MSCIPQVEELYVQYRPKIERYVKSHVSNVSDADDVVADIFVKMIAALPRYDSAKGAVSTWIYTITRNTVTDYFRTTGKTIPYDSIKDERQEGMAEEQLLKEEALAWLAQLLGKLSERKRDILILRFYCDYSPKEIAECMGISYANVRYLQSVALKELRRWLEKMGKQAEL